MPIDSAIDGPSSGMVTLSETANSTMVYGGSIACFNSLVGSTGDSNWYRIFAPSEFNVTNVLHISQVSFSVQESAGNPTVTIKIGTYSGNVGDTPLATAKITAVAQTTAPIPATTGQNGETVNAPITADIPAGAKFTVEILAPDLTGNLNNYIFIGATTAGETHPGYYQSASCGPAAPQTTVSQGGTGQIIINVQGTH